jgi:hypothetical protein
MNLLPEPQQPFITHEAPAPASPAYTALCLAATLLVLVVRVIALFS